MSNIYITIITHHPNKWIWIHLSYKQVRVGKQLRHIRLIRFLKLKGTLWHQLDGIFKLSSGSYLPNLFIIIYSGGGGLGDIERGLKRTSQ